MGNVVNLGETEGSAYHSSYLGGFVDHPRGTNRSDLT